MKDGHDRSSPYLSRLLRDVVPANSNQSTSNSANSPSNSFDNNSGDQNQDIFATIERLGQLQQQGLITQEEYGAKKAELLGRL